MSFQPSDVGTGIPPNFITDPIRNPDIVRVLINPDGTLATIPANSNRTALPVVMSGVGASHHGTVNATGTQSVSLSNTSRSKLTVQNTDAANTLYLSFTSPATVNDIAIAPGGSINFDVAPVNALYGLSSAVTTAWAAMEITT